MVVKVPNVYFPAMGCTMLIRTISLILAMLLLLVVAMSCDSDRCVQPVPCCNVCDEDRTEAELAAIWLSGELVAPDSLYRRLLWGFTTMREKYGQHIAEVAIRFQFPVRPSVIDVKLTDSAAQQFLDGSYTEWDSLNNRFGLRHLDTGVCCFEHFHYVRLMFGGLQHPNVIAGEYRELEGIQNSGSSEHAEGDWSNMYPWIANGKLTFLLRSAWGDCPAGCMYSRFWYFVEEQDGLILVGKWEDVDIQSPPPPAWWDEASVAFHTYLYRTWP
ncbi:MAG: hypothetical protein ABII79_07870 [bacterium]